MTDRDLSALWAPLDDLRKDQGCGTFLCDGYRLGAVATIAELLGLIDRAEAAHPAHRVLATLDDLRQASYTSLHAISLNGLEEADADEVSAAGLAPATEIEIDALTRSTAWFPVRLAKIRRAAEPLGFDALRGRLVAYIRAEVEDAEVRRINPDGTLGETFIDRVDLDFDVDYGLPDLLLLNRNPDRVLDAETYLLVAPVRSAHALVAAFPNGYFSDHLAPHELWALAVHFEGAYGYELFGIGAACVGFRRRAALASEAAARLASDIAALDGSDEAVAQVGNLAAMLQARPFFLLHYAC